MWVRAPTLLSERKIGYRLWRLFCLSAGGVRCFGRQTCSSVRRARAGYFGSLARNPFEVVADGGPGLKGDRISIQVDVPAVDLAEVLAGWRIQSVGALRRGPAALLAGGPVRQPQPDIATSILSPVVASCTEQSAAKHTTVPSWL